MSSLIATMTADDLTIWHFAAVLAIVGAVLAIYATRDWQPDPHAAHRAALTAATDDRTHGLGTAASAGGEPAPVPAPPGAAIAAGETSPNSPAALPALVAR